VSIQRVYCGATIKGGPCAAAPRSLPGHRVRASPQDLARKGVLYFNLHTKANTFYGEVRGQIYPATDPK
jgi:hypothetical protein